MRKYISQEIEKVAMQIQDLVGAVIVSYYLVPDISIPIIRLPEYTQVADRETWEGVTFEIAKRSFEILGLPEKKPTLSVFDTNKMYTRPYTIAGYAFSLEREKWEEKDESDAIARNSNISICLLIRKGKEGQLRKKKVRTQLQEVLREIEEIIQKSKYIKSVRHWFVYLEQIGLRTGFHGAIEMLNQFIHFTIPGQLGNEPIYSWVEQTGGGKLQVKYRVQLGFRPRIQ